ncbi:hypothetical protein AJ78_05691 [Emergomyces pasteurianus Ep9510]|uniref:Uncharacterized protein n=1 Tax=Emergomyces pasteurianus Ep9510 TaxID=1447872 RepID=A0A1J9QFE0_9EURO|nr:hypothetical protein AJ78_05691 [Emergomyces pasteurianus Ep9510]
MAIHSGIMGPGSSFSNDNGHVFHQLHNALLVQTVTSQLPCCTADKSYFVQQKRGNGSIHNDSGNNTHASDANVAFLFI